MISLAEITAPRAVAFNPDALAYEAFSLGREDKERTRLLDPLQAETLDDALAEATSRWSWDRGDRIGIREIGGATDRLLVYAVRRKAQGSQVWRGHVPTLEYRRWLELVATVDLIVLAGIGQGLVGCELELHERRQRERPVGARL